ncbi:transcription factor cwo-like isoform X2 [Physella acuta]|uniref:transcription factor cwo-like isoform X2 n=1 Tax=Physella acuta TaxID=109671 RepID=UPI0027DD5067|nr:transcription factor cwo-like isoform X2 [Physella acuta]
MEGDESNQSLMDDPPGAKRAKMEITETDRLLNFATAADEFELSLKRQKIPRDPMSHRIIEKRRRDRMNNCLADLSRLIPSSYHKQGQGRIEKTEIIEMAIKHINMLQQKVDDYEKKNSREDKPQPAPSERNCCATKFYMGFKEAQDEAMRFLVEVESVNAMDPFCKKFMNHLENASKKFITEQISHTPHLTAPHGTMNGEVEKSDLTRLDGDISGQPAFLQQRSSFYSASSSGFVSQDENHSSSENKNRDQHLRSLLGEQQHGITSSKSVSESGSGSNCMVPLFSYSNHLHGLGSTSDQNGMGSSGYVSDLSNMEKTSPSGSTSSSGSSAYKIKQKLFQSFLEDAKQDYTDNVYKFKHNITKRFSQEGHHHHMHHHMQHHHHNHGHPSDTSSSTSSRDLEDDQSQLKWKSNKHKTRHASLGNSNTIYRNDGQNEGNNSPNSDEFHSASVSNDCSKRRPNKSGSQVSNRSNENNSSSVALPGFILHPQGTHYMPISVHNTNIGSLFENSVEHDGPPVFHPISIPVHFRRPVISMPNITICTHMSTQRKERNIQE